MYDIYEMTQEHAEEIIHWTYPAPYDLYDMQGTNEVLAELLIGDYYSVSKESGLVGFFCYGGSARVMIPEAKECYLDEDVMDIGLGLRPDLCGQGQGTDFMGAGLKYAKEHFKPSAMRLTVARFNQRAVRLYTQIGFTECGRFIRESDACEFIVMKYEWRL